MKGLIFDWHIETSPIQSILDTNSKKVENSYDVLGAVARDATK